MADGKGKRRQTAADILKNFYDFTVLYHPEFAGATRLLPPNLFSQI